MGMPKNIAEAMETQNLRDGSHRFFICDFVDLDFSLWLERYQILPPRDYLSAATDYCEKQIKSMIKQTMDKHELRGCVELLGDVVADVMWRRYGEEAGESEDQLTKVIKAAVYQQHSWLLKK